MAKKKQGGSNTIGWIILAALGFGIYQFGIVGDGVGSTPAPRATQPAASAPAQTRAMPLDAPRFVNVASLNVRHLPSTSSPLIMELPRGTPLRVLGRQDGWLLVDINPTLEGWVAERLTTTETPQKGYTPPAPVKVSR
jgi:hypothetical protein